METAIAALERSIENLKMTAAGHDNMIQHYQKQKDEANTEVENLQKDLDKLKKDYPKK